MRPADLYVFLPAPRRGAPLAEYLEAAVAVEQMGYRGIWVGEATGPDPFAFLAAVGLRTRRVELGTGVAHVYARTPAAIAQGALTVSALAGGRRVNLGLGTSTPRLVSGLHGMPVERPVERLSRYVDDVRTLCGETDSSPTPAGRSGRIALRRPCPALPPRIFLAALSTRSLQLTGRKADGWLPIWPSLTHFHKLRARVADAAAAAGRPMPRTAAYVYTCPVADPQLSRAALARALTYVIATHDGGYRNLFRSYGLSELVETVDRHWAEGDRMRATAALPADTLDDLAAVGDPARTVGRLELFRRAGIDDVVLRAPDDIELPDVLEMYSALADRMAADAA